MKIAHEAPIGIFDKVQRLTDYDYCLVHLLDENEEYLAKFREAKAKGREIILDNSIFELGESYDPDRFAYWVKELEPDWYIVPDSLENKQKTIGMYNEFITKYPDLPGKAMVVVQGKSYEEIVYCYGFFKMEHKLGNVGKIAISFDYSFFEDMYYAADTKFHAYTLGRQHVLRRMLEEGVINTDIPHHLLGAGLPQEFAYYRHWDWIDSIDTSNPVVHGILSKRYKRLPEYDIYGLDNKESVKLFTLIDTEVEEKMDDILYNIEKFRYNTFK